MPYRGVLREKKLAPTQPAILTFQNSETVKLGEFICLMLSHHAQHPQRLHMPLFPQQRYLNKMRNVISNSGQEHCWSFAPCRWELYLHCSPSTLTTLCYHPENPFANIVWDMRISVPANTPLSDTSQPNKALIAAELYPLQNSVTNPLGHRQSFFQTHSHHDCKTCCLGTRTVGMGGSRRAGIISPHQQFSTYHLQTPPNSSTKSN